MNTKLALLVFLTSLCGYVVGAGCMLAFIIARGL